MDLNSLDRLIEIAEQVLGTQRLAKNWMESPARGLDGQKPIDLIACEEGYEQVADLLTRMDYGVY